MEAGSRLPKPSSMKMASMATPPACARTTADSPSDSARETRNFSPPERVRTSRSPPKYPSSTCNSRPSSRARVRAERTSSR